MLNFPPSPTVGQQYTEGAKTWEWTGVAWDAVAISDVLVERAETAATDAAASASAAAADAATVLDRITPSVNYFSGDGVTTAFTLPTNPGGENNTRVHIGGVYQHKSAYEVSGTTLTFSAAPPAGTNNIEVEVGPAGQVTVTTATSDNVAFVPQGGGASTTVEKQLRGQDAPAPAERGFWTNVGSGANIHRLRDRVFVGDGCDSSGENANTGNETWLTSQMGAHYFERAAQFMSLSTVGKYAGVFATRSSDQAEHNPTGETAIGIVGVALNDFAGTAKTAWAAYLEAVRSSGVNGFTHGVEIAVKNKGDNITQTPYSFNNGGATHGIWFAGGADPSYDGAPANPSAAAMVVVKNGSTWNRGLVITKDSLTGADGTTGTAIAIQMAKGHKIDWQHAAGQGASIWSEITTAANAVNLTFFEGSTSFVNNNKLLLKIDTVQTPVNSIGIAAIGSSGGVPNVYARGDDANVDLGLYTKGTGVWRANYASTVATTPANFTADRMFKFKDSSGNVYYIPCRSATW